ncbi:hypothetical protein ACE7GA_03020 [Roseomonas sp. CCTCC AB2023176]|uniref:hypothetical protein n=1 Tax=Roseomonas sp. CCTCC AB2023176 TaxID=3342640 RepID=UPI0035E2CD8F
MWNEPYLETCCRAALHRLFLTAGGTRPAGLPDEACLRRMAGMGWVCESAPDRFSLTSEGAARHAAEVLRRAA